VEFNPDALYQALLRDLSVSLPLDIIVRLSKGEKVEPWPDITTRQQACLAMAKSYYKKFVVLTVPTADLAALDKFNSVNMSCADWVLKLESARDEELWGCLQRHLYRFFHRTATEPLVSSFGQIFAHGRVGPGSSIGSEGGDFYTKMFSSKLTYTNASLYRAYTNYISQHPTWSDAEFIRDLHYGNENIVTGNRLSFVPKQRDISRVICVEPTLNMFAQLGLASILEARLKSYFGIDLSTQPEKNRELARLGSQFGTYFTVDLSSASDSMSLKMLRALLPRDTLAWFEILRSPKCTLPSGEQVDMNMISTMGNGFTFPLQTILFASIVSACQDFHSLERDGRRVDSKRGFGVFGDDIVAESHLYRDVVRLLTLCGFVVNADKSFSEGPFRESCGGDFHLGFPVRGVYVKALSTPQERAVVLNRMHHWSSITGVYLSECTSMLFKTIPKRFVPYWENDDAGIKVPMSLIRKPIWSKRTHSIIYRKWVNLPRRLRIRGWESLAMKKRIYNPYGLSIAFLAGHIRSESIPVRQTVNRYTTKASVAPSWDPSRRSLTTEVSWQRWETAVWYTLVR